MYLVKFDRDWADELTVYGFAVITDEYKALWDAFCEKYKKKTFTYYFGTNEGWDDERLQDIQRDYEFTKISDEEANVFKKLFGRGEVIKFGIIPLPSDLLEEIWYAEYEGQIEEVEDE